METGITPQGKIDLDNLRELRENAKKQEKLEDRIRHNNLIESEKARVRELIPLIPRKLEQAARKGQGGCALLEAEAVWGHTTYGELKQHPAYGELIRYLESQGLTKMYFVPFNLEGTDIPKGISICVELP